MGKRWLRGEVKVDFRRFTFREMENWSLRWTLNTESFSLFWCEHTYFSVSPKVLLIILYRLQDAIWWPVFFISNHNIPFVFRVLLLLWYSPFTVVSNRACLILLRIDKIILIISPLAGGSNVVKLPEKVWTAAKVAFILILLGHLFVPILR